MILEVGGEVLGLEQAGLPRNKRCIPEPLGYLAPRHSNSDSANISSNRNTGGNILPSM